MPFYEYECPHCKFYAEVMQRISDPPLKKCSSCGKAGFKRLISAPVFRLKGSGWYETDFKSDKENKRNLVGSDSEPAAAAKTETETKTETKPESKPEAKADSGTKPAGKAEAKAEAKPAVSTPARSSSARKTGARRAPPARGAKRKGGR
jgi:putative FmdB family regulatory protein